ncbi:MAG: hypothetical protein LUO89_12810 [Methanothrix sp.]|nr:hypothetical protein [Methanothrix sp.]
MASQSRWRSILVIRRLGRSIFSVLFHGFCELGLAGQVAHQLIHCRGSAAPSAILVATFPG